MSLFRLRTDSGPIAPPLSLVMALKRLLRPLVRLLLSFSVQYPYLANLLKLTYVEVATREFPLDDRPQTDSRISLLTGIHRQDVKRLRGEMMADAPPPPVVSLGAQLVSRWLGEAAYLDGKGRPKPLPRQAAQGGEASFERLVQTVNTDIRPRVVLDEWMRLGVAELDKQDRVVLRTEAFVPAHGVEEKLFYFGKVIHDHLAASEHNLTSGQPPLLDRCVYFDQLTEQSAQQLADYARSLAGDAMQALNRKALELQESDAAKADATNRINFGLYFYRADEASTVKTSL
jgi:Family of unknown function (DUF6502)